MPRKPTLKSLKAKSDKLFSEYIRRKYADENGFVKCFTCGNVKRWKEQQCGHFVSRRHLSTRWDERNARPQCGACNVLRRGHYDVYALRLQRESFGILEELNVQKNMTRQMKRSDYEDLIAELKQKLLDLE